MNSQQQPRQAETRPLSLVEKASILTETLPWLETYAGKIVCDQVWRQRHDRR